MITRAVATRATVECMARRRRFRYTPAMTWLSAVFIVVGLALFETISSIDNAIINAEVLATMSSRARRWFLLWGMIFAVFAIRGALPWLIVWLTIPSLGPIGALTATFSSDPSIHRAIDQSSPILFIAGGTFLLFLFLSWLFLEEKSYGLPGERFFTANGVWFYAVVSVLLCLIVWHALAIDKLLALGAVVGSTAFFITHGFKQNAEAGERTLAGSAMSDVSKILYLELIDATFSIDGVLGAFAFTLSIPLILVGNGIGSFIVRSLTVGNIQRLSRLRFLKNGAMYSILCLGVVMLLDALDYHVPEWVSPALTFVIVGFFFLRSRGDLARRNSEP